MVRRSRNFKTLKGIGTLLGLCTCEDLDHLATVSPGWDVTKWTGQMAMLQWRLTWGLPSSGRNYKYDWTE